MSWKKQIVDQLAHIGFAILVVVFVTIIGGTFDTVAGAGLGLALGICREYSEPDEIDSIQDLLDILFWTIGGAIGGYIF